MRWLIPFASPLSEAGRSALATLALPNLSALLAQMAEAETDAGDEWSLTPPHERALARELALEGADGLLPWAAHFAAQDGIATRDLAWGLLTPAHWNVGAEMITLTDPQALALDAPDSRALLDAVRCLFEPEGFEIAWGAPLRWYAAHPMLAGLATASLDRVVGRNVDRWLPAGREARTIRRLQSEVQMLLHTHRLNEQREANGEWAVNSFWLSGCGVRQPARDAADLVVLDALRRPALSEDWTAWSEAWRALDAGIVGDALADGGPHALTLAGERSSIRFERRQRGWLERLSARWKGVDAREILGRL